MHPCFVYDKCTSDVFWMDVVVSLGNSTTECDCVEPTTAHLLSERARQRERGRERERGWEREGVGRRGERERDTEGKRKREKRDGAK